MQARYGVNYASWVMMVPGDWWLVGQPGNVRNFHRYIQRDLNPVLHLIAQK